MTLRLLQHEAPNGQRRGIAARAGDAGFFRGVDTGGGLALDAIARGSTLEQLVDACGTEAEVDIKAELRAGRLIAPIDHPDPAHVFLTGTGLTHLGSAEGRDQMHRAAAQAERQTDSM